MATTKDTLSGERLVPTLPNTLVDLTTNAVVIPLIPLYPSLLCAAELREEETPLGRVEHGGHETLRGRDSGKEWAQGDGWEGVGG